MNLKSIDFKLDHSKLHPDIGNGAMNPENSLNVDSMEAVGKHEEVKGSKNHGDTD